MPLVIDYQRCMAPMIAAERAVARLDTTLKILKNHAAYLTISRLQEAVLCAHSEGYADVDVEKLAVVLHDPMESYQPASVRAALAVHRALGKLHHLDGHGLAFAAEDLAMVAGQALADGMACDQPLRQDAPLDPRGFARWLTACEDLADLPPLISLALAFARFHHLRPCGALSPRVARVLLPSVAHALQLTQTPCLFLGQGLSQKEGAALLLPAPLGNATPWIETFCAAIATAADHCRHRVEHLHRLKERYQGKFADSRSTNAARKVVAILFERPLLDLTTLQTLPSLGRGKGGRLSKRGSLLVMERLLQAGLVEEITDRDRFRLYLAWDIVRL
jgi:hypothetical protein